MVKHELPEITKAWKCEVRTDVDTFSRLFANYFRTQEQPLFRPLQKMLRDLPTWAGVIFYHPGYKMEVVAVLHITQISPNTLELLLEQCKLSNAEKEEKVESYLQPVFSFLRESYMVKLHEQRIVPPRRMRLALLKMELAFESEVKAVKLNKWFEDFCYKYDGNAWIIHYSSVGGFVYNTIDRIYANAILDKEPSFLQCMFLECVEIWSLYCKPSINGKVFVEVYAWKQGEIFEQIQTDLQQWFAVRKAEGDSQPLLTGNQETYTSNQVEHQRTESKTSEIVQTWIKESWYIKLTIEERQRYDWLRPYKERWESGETTNEDLAQMFAKSADTIRGWRRNLKGKNCPDMDWKKQKSGV